MSDCVNSAGRRSGSALAVVVAVGAMVLMAGAGGLLAMHMSSDGGNQTTEEESAPGQEDPEMEYVEFGSVVVNLAEGRLTRYLKLSIVLEVNKEHAEQVNEIVDGGEKATVTNWLITYLSGLQLEDVKGSEGVESVRRRVEAGFEEVLAERDGAEIEKVFFEEFNVQ